jgi:phage-related protein
MTPASRAIAWIKSALKDFGDFPAQAQDEMRFALTVAAEGGKSKIALAHRGDAYRVVYVVQLDDALWVVHAFQKKSTKGIKTPKHEVDLIVDRIKRLKQMLKESQA